MTLPVAFVFHFNQPTTDYADLANRVCYHGLLTVLRAHPALKFNLHLSGTLLRALPWFDTETLALIRAGVADGQFEVLGSTYAQNVPYASDDWDNAQQIGLHRAVLHDLLGVTPSTFWNAERCWRPSLAPVIVEGGYTTTLIEDHILHAAGVVDPIPAGTCVGEQSLTLVCDDTLLRSRVNYAAWFGRTGQLLDYLRRMAQRPGSQQFLLAYAEDAEAMGLWGWERGYIPNATWAHLEALFSEVEASGLIELRHLASAQSQTTSGPLPHGAAQWMTHALLNPHAPYHESDYSDWFDFNARAPKLRYFRNLYRVVRSRLQALGSAHHDPGFGPSPATSIRETLYRRAIETFCHHQYEFGCVGVGGRKYWGWENVRAAFLLARVAEMAAEPEVANWIEDVNGDGADEQLLCDGRQVLVLSSYGGRLIHWSDLTDGRQWAGNHLALPPAPFDEPASHLTAPRTQLRWWAPENIVADLKPLKAYREKETAPTALGRHLPAWVFEREAPTLTVYRRKMRRPGHSQRLMAQTGIFTDTLQIDADAPGPPNALLDYRLEDGAVFCYLLFPAPDLLIEKRVRLTPEGLMVHYTFDNRDEVARRVRLTSANELNPDYAAVLAGGGPGHSRALDFYMHAGLYPGVVNTRTQAALALEASQEWTQIERVVNLLALEVRLTFEVMVAPRASSTLEIKLNRVQA